MESVLCRADLIFSASLINYVKPHASIWKVINNSKTLFMNFTSGYSLKINMSLFWVKSLLTFAYNESLCESFVDILVIVARIDCYVHS